MKLQPVRSKQDITLDDDAATFDTGKSEEELERATEKQVKRISKLQQVFYANDSYALLIVLQGRDASGKDGTIRKVFSAVNPQGCIVSSFKRPTELELHHDFLWRVHHQIPPRGVIGIFNRSHYEDVIVPVVQRWLPKKTIAARYAQINDFERMLAANAVVILKFFLHISRDEQKKRLQARLDDPTKNWKFNPGDLEDRKHWSRFTKAYETMLNETSTSDAPWFIVPANDNDTRNYLIARIIADTMDELGLEYPKIDPAMKKVKIE